MGCRCKENVFVASVERMRMPLVLMVAWTTVRGCMARTGLPVWEKNLFPSFPLENFLDDGVGGRR